MMRAMMVLAGLLIATPVLAASDGTYRGDSSELLQIFSGWGCFGASWEFRVTGNHVKAARMAHLQGGQKGLTGLLRLEGELQPDGSISLSGSTPYSPYPIVVHLTGKFTNDSFEGIDRNNWCEYRTTATKSWW